MTIQRFVAISAAAGCLVFCGDGARLAAAAGATALTTLSATKAVNSSATTTSSSGGTFLSPSMIPGAAGTAGNSRTAAASGSGNRALTNRTNRTTSRSEPPGASPDPTEGEEFLIDRNRGRGSFVGHDSTDATGFVGEGRAIARAAIRSAILALRASRGNALVNPVRPARPANTVYDPRLVVGFDFASRPTAAVSSTLTQELMASTAIQRTGPIEVSVEAGKATLRGEVAAERDRALAEQWLLFEPGIDSVQNLLTVKPPSSSPSYAPAPQK